MKASSGRESGFSLRAILIGLFFTALCDLWIHWAELVLGSRGHTALANTSIPVGAFNILFLLTVINMVLNRVFRPLALSRPELLVIYVMLTVSTVISSSGGIHFIVPTITAAFWYADRSNNWSSQFLKYIPDWIAQKNHGALKGFYDGNSQVPWSVWSHQILAWWVFMALFAMANLCLVSILRRLWIDRERLGFPTVAVPIALIREPDNLFKNGLFRIGFLLPFSVDIMNTFHLNVPSIPYFPTRTADQPDILNLFHSPPWNAIGSTPISLYPFVIGIAYLISVEMSFSCWFFWLATKLELVFGSAAGINAGAAAGGLSSWPYISQQGAGAFLGITLVGFWLSRSYFKEIAQILIGKIKKGDDGSEPLPYRIAFLGLLLCIGGLTGWCMAAGMHGMVAITLIILSLIYIISATRIRAETGDAWLFGPNTDPFQVMTTTFGTSFYRPVDLTILAYVRNAIANYDLRCITMPNQFDAFKMADAIQVDKRKLTAAMVLSTLLGILVSMAIALMIWYAFGAGAKTDPWRTSMGRLPFDQLSISLSSPLKADRSGTAAILAGFLITALLMVLRMRFTWWIFNPIGYAIANTSTMNQVWLPFFIAWVVKTLILRYGGIKSYQKSLPFFYGLIMGDFIAGGLTTLAGCLTGVNVYPTNW